MAERRRYQDRAKYLIEAVRRRRQAIRQRAVEYLGGRCQICGYNRCLSALDFHHRDEKEKRFGISARGYTRAWETVRQEIEKCFLLCANCHREVHANILQLPSETAVEHRVNCREAPSGTVSPRVIRSQAAGSNAAEGSETIRPAP